MNWLDVLMITFSAVAANHLGLVAAVESVILHRLPVVNCPKCAAFWLVLAYGLGCEIHFTTTHHLVDANDMVAYHFEHVLEMLAAAFLSAWSAIWLDLFMGIIDQLYIKVYDTIYPTANTSNADALDTTDTVSDVSGSNQHDD